MHNNGIRHCTKEVFVDDTLHTLDLGLVQRYIGTSLMKILKTDPYETGVGLVEDVLQDNVICLRRGLKPFYKVQRKACAGRKITTIKKLSVEMLGDPHTPSLKAHGAESRELLPFVIRLLMRFIHKGDDSWRLLIVQGNLCKHIIV